MSLLEEALACGCTVIGGKVINWCELHRDTRGRDMLLEMRAERDALRERVADYEEVLEDKRRIARELDVAMHGEEGAAKQASLCDLIGPAKALRERVAARDTELASIRHHLGGHRYSQLDGANGLAQATYSVMRRAEARVSELEEEVERLRDGIESAVAAFNTDYPFDSNVRLVVDEVRRLLSPTKEETDAD